MVGLVGTKIGMTQVFDETGELTPVSVIRIDENVVVGSRTLERNGYSACILGAIDKKESRVTKPYAGQFPEGVPVKKHLFELRDFSLEYEIGNTFGVEVFSDVRYVDITGTSKGKGYQGVMKRHGFGGGRKTHGSKFQRGLGSTGMAATPSKVHRGTKMPGRMGGVQRTVQNLRVIEVDQENGLLQVLPLVGPTY